MLKLEKVEISLDLKEFLPILPWEFSQFHHGQIETYKTCGIAGYIIIDKLKHVKTRRIATNFTIVF